MTPEPITCRCPACRAKYRVPSTAVGHRARCRACGSLFRVVERLSRPPTDDDILRWLREAEEQDERTELRETTLADELARQGSSTDADPPTDEGRVIPLRAKTVAVPTPRPTPSKARTA